MPAGFSEPDTNTAEHRERRGRRDEPEVGRVWHTGKRYLRNIAENPEGGVVTVEQVLDEGGQRMHAVANRRHVRHQLQDRRE